MHKEDVQSLLDRSGFTVTLNKKIGGTSRVHMMHVGKTYDKLVDYIIDESLNTTKAIWAYTMEELTRIESTEDLENWLNRL